ncbi:MAG: [Fe-Fe] hydrogenase large subunit C-terminal domain-containing protein [Clostridiaceae bacterium]|jgi:iron only hydrogenase large subunit-like protein|nr:[Fe-Fe] hydrogenase large subunit C-terminal domain-containing protein [Clostridiaceae bacterium]
MTDYLKFKKSNCKNCYKCIRHCPVKAIAFANNQANIVPEECILCGECVVICPQNAKRIREDLPKANKILESGVKVYASVAPSVAAAFPEVSFESVKAALIKLGFAGAEETAIGATIVKRRYEELILENKQQVIISTCCHSVNTLVQKYYPAALPYLAKVVSPMLAHGMSIKKAHPGSKVIFIGPCISKKSEAEEYPGIIDCVLTFEDIRAWFEQRDIMLDTEQKSAEAIGKTRLFPTRGGILDSMNISQTGEYSLLAVDGVSNCIAALEDVINGSLEHCFIEMSACVGSCIGGPAMGKGRSFPVRDCIAVRRSAGREDFPVEQPEDKILEKKIPAALVKGVKYGGSAIEEVLRKMEKTLPEHELNCGSCGYETCREKAAAVLAGKAEITMCLPYLAARAESFSGNIINNTPNGIIVLNSGMEIQQINAAACRLMNIGDEKSVLGRNVACILDPGPFAQAASESRNVYEQQVYIAEYRKYVRMTIVIDSKSDIIIAFMRDVTKEYTEQADKEEFNRKAIEITDKVIKKQMRTVQEIASLLGETTAETKVALEQLKETLR